MNKMKLHFLFVLGIFLGLVACDNDVDLTAEYEDTTVVYALINANADTQFVKVNRAFLEANTNALSLARDANNFTYDDLDVALRNLNTDALFPLKQIEKPKEEGVFSTEKNILFYTDTALQFNNNYRIEVTQPDGKLTYADAVAIDTLTVTRPEISNLRVRSLPLTNTNGTILEYKFEFAHSARVAKFEAVLFFHYIEELQNGSRVPKSIRIPIGTVNNPDLVAKQDASIDFPGTRFYQTIANSIPLSNQNKKLVDPSSNISIEIYAADETYTFYSDVYGPIEGLAQVKPEYTNVENGIGLFASRSRTIARTFLADPSRQQLRSGPITGNLNFQDL